MFNIWMVGFLLMKLAIGLVNSIMIIIEIIMVIIIMINVLVILFVMFIVVRMELKEKMMLIRVI